MATSKELIDKYRNSPGFKRQRNLTMKKQVVDRIINSQRERIKTMTKAGQFEDSAGRKKYNQQLNKLARASNKRKALDFDTWSKG
jgi:hypothetical protein